MAVKYKKTGLTLVEILIVLGIIALLVGLLLPALTTVKNSAKEAKQKANFGAINLALVNFKNDYGDFPPSNCPRTGFGSDYCGAQKLAEALLGWDLMGFHPNTAWRADGLDINGGNTTYDPLKTRDDDKNGTLDTFKERKSLYIDSETANAFKLGDAGSAGTGIFPYTNNLKPDTKVLCDVFPMKRKVVVYVNKLMPNGSYILEGKQVSAGSPILYYRANTSQNLINEIYKVMDNDPLVYVKEQTDEREQPLGRPEPVNDIPYGFFYNYIRDPKVETIPQPYRRDSYILISAGSDGIYGTPDDIKNFGE